MIYPCNYCGFQPIPRVPFTCPGCDRRLTKIILVSPEPWTIWDLIKAAWLVTQELVRRP